MKDRIQKRLERRIEQESKEKTKLRFCGGFSRKKYLMKGNMSKNMVKGILKTRLNMLELNCNYKSDSRSEMCDLCKQERDTTEHLFNCNEITKQIQNVPRMDILKNDSEEAYSELGKFIEEVSILKGIDLAKTARENLENTLKKQQENKVYKITSFNQTCLKMVISIT